MNEHENALKRMLEGATSGLRSMNEGQFNSCFYKLKLLSAALTVPEKASRIFAESITATNTCSFIYPQSKWVRAIFDFDQTRNKALQPVKLPNELEFNLYDSRMV